MDDALERIWTHLIGRVSGPMSFRLVLQPVMATLFALRDGARDAREGRPPYLRTLFTHSPDRAWLLRDGWKAIGRVVILAVVMDLIYQWMVFRRFYPVEVIDVVIILAVFPYALLRGLADRFIRYLRRPDSPGGRGAANQNS